MSCPWAPTNVPRTKALSSLNHPIYVTRLCGTWKGLCPCSLLAPVVSRRSIIWADMNRLKDLDNANIQFNGLELAEIANLAFFHKLKLDISELHSQQSVMDDS